MLGIGTEIDFYWKKFMSDRILVSLIVPTYNRADDLKNALASFLNQSLNKKFYEIIVVDNNSSDHTRFVVDDINRLHSSGIRYIFECRQGLHNARNIGASSALGEIIIFGDDDIKASYFWLETIWNEFKFNSSTGIVGGKILPEWEGSPPEWIYDYGSNKTHAVFAYLDYGDSRKVLDREYVIGCNFAIRRHLIEEIGGSAPDRLY